MVSRGPAGPLFFCLDFLHPRTRLRPPPGLTYIYIDIVGRVVAARPSRALAGDPAHRVRARARLARGHRPRLDRRLLPDLPHPVPPPPERLGPPAGSGAAPGAPPPPLPGHRGGPPGAAPLARGAATSPALERRRPGAGGLPRCPAAARPPQGAARSTTPRCRPSSPGCARSPPLADIAVSRGAPRWSSARRCAASCAAAGSALCPPHRPRARSAEANAAELHGHPDV